MQERSVTLHLGCCCAKKIHCIKLNNSLMKEYSTTTLESMNIDPYKISEITLGPKTVIETFQEPLLQGKKRLVANSSDKNKIIYIGCVQDHLIWEGYVRSFRLWDYDAYMDNQKPTYCNINSECSENEYCLCPTGQSHPEWCPVQGKRCMPKNKYIQSKLPELKDVTIIDSQCLHDELYKQGNIITSFDDVRKASMQCSKRRQIKYIEGFNDISNRTFNLNKFMPYYIENIYLKIFTAVLAVMILLYVYKNK